MTPDRQVSRGARLWTGPSLLSPPKQRGPGPDARDVCILETPPSPSPGPFSSLCPNLALGPQGMGQAHPIFLVSFSSLGGGILEAGGPSLGACLL